jgi:hypothetical protein
MDIDNQLKENIKGEMLLLPKETQEVINSFKFREIFTEISKAHKFSDEEAKKLETETILILLGLVDSKLYAQNIENNIGTSEQAAKDIEKEISERIFNPICEKVVEKVRQNIQYNKMDWKQTVNFIVSGGNYSIFIEQKNKPNIVTNPPSVNIKNNFTI